MKQPAEFNENIFLEVYLWPAGIGIAYTTSNFRKNGRKTIFG